MPSTLASRITAVLGTGAVVLAAATGQASGALVTAPVIGTTPNLIADRPFTYPLALAWDITTIGSKTYAVTVATAQGGMVNVIELDTDVAHTGANDATINIFNGPMETSTTEWGASQSTVLPDKSVLFGTNRGGLVWVRPGPSAPATQKALFHLPFAVSTAGADAAKRYYSSISDYTTMLNTYTISHHGDTTTVVFVALRSNQGMDGKIVAYNYDCMSRVTTTTLVRSVGFFKRQFARVLGRPTIWSLGLLGLLNGWLPCGLVYAAGGAAVADVLFGRVNPSGKLAGAE